MYGEECRRCGCHWSEHYHAVEKLELVTDQAVNEAVMKDININMSEQQKKQRMTKNCEEIEKVINFIFLFLNV